MCLGLAAARSDLSEASRPAIRNLGPVSRAWLDAVEVPDLATLQALGAVAVYRRVQAAGFPASRNLLHALAAAIQGVEWRQLTAAHRVALNEAADAATPSDLPLLD